MWYCNARRRKAEFIPASSGTSGLPPPGRSAYAARFSNAQFVGLLTNTFGRNRPRRFPPSQVSPMTRFRGKEVGSVLTARRVCPPCSGFAPDSLVQLNKNACLPFRSVAHLPQNKPDIYLHRRNPGGGFCFLDTAASAPTAVLREEKLFLGQSKQLNGSSDSIGKS